MAVRKGRLELGDALRNDPGGDLRLDATGLHQLARRVAASEHPLQLRNLRTILLVQPLQDAADNGLDTRPSRGMRHAQPIDERRVQAALHRLGNGLHGQHGSAAIVYVVGMDDDNLGVLGHQVRGPDT